ncbi:MAG: hypothetical protein ACFCVK_05560 [Acidimicrobiales bacterium]
MLHPFDDHPIHQTSEPMLHVATTSPDAYDRFFYNGFDPEGDVFFAVALGVYPNRRVMDGAFSLVRHGIQHNVRASRLAPADRTETTIGPLTVTIVEPMRHHRITVDDRFGLSADLTWTMLSPAIEEPRFRHVAEGRALFDYTRLTQFGRWEGWIDLDGERIEIAPDGTLVGVRDRSWGVRPVGDRIPGPATEPQFFWIWAPTVFDDVCTHLALNHLADGQPWHQSGAVAARLGPDEDPLDPGLVRRATTADVDVAWGAGTRWAKRATTTLGLWGDEPVVIAYEPILRFQMSGVGYRHPRWGHGRWLGEAEAERDALDLATVDPEDPTMIHIQALCRARWGERTGVGVVEQLVVGDHRPTGLRGPVAGFGS